MARARAMRTGSNSTDVEVEKDGNLARAAASALGSIRGGVDMGDLRECWRIGASVRSDHSRQGRRIATGRAAKSAKTRGPRPAERRDTYTQKAVTQAGKERL